MTATTRLDAPTQQLDETDVARCAARFQNYLAATRQVEGWFSDPSAAIWDSLLDVQERCGLQGDLLEIGVWAGKSAGMLASRANAGERLLLVDCEMRTDAITETMRRVRIPEGVGIDALEDDSTELWHHALMKDGYRKHRWIHIDGEHTARAVVNDMELANQLLGKEGVLVVDDFFNWLYPQITEAVMRYVRERPEHFALFLVGYNKAYLARPHFVHRYLEACHLELPAGLELRGQETTVAHTTLPGEMNTFGVGPRFQGKALRGPDWDPDSILR